ncbi:MAG: hypothetical protein IKQ61_04335 [Spirochaetales bacterium]|nr:hypothetical protein [Spirochaetales bacterium]
MIIKELVIEEGLISQSNDSFSEKRNLIHSKRNSCGKSTLLRLLFFSMGYQIPNMKGMDFSSIKTTLVFEEKEKVFIVKRKGAVLDIELEDGNIITYSLPSQHIAFLTYIFEYEKVKVLKNLLGVIYIDQEKGWTLLNRGTVIGQIKFGIEELLAGLNNKDISDSLDKIKQLNINKSRYESVQNMQQLQEQVYKKNNEIFLSNEEQDFLNKISFEKLKLANLEKSLYEINSLIKSEKNFFDYIDSMRLYVKHRNERIPVNRETLDNSFSIQESLKARKSILVGDIERQRKNVRTLERKLAEYKMKKNFQLFKTDDIEKEIEIKIAQTNFNIDQEILANLVKKTNDELKSEKNNIKTQVKTDNDFIQQIYEYVIKYSEALKIDKSIIYKEDFIFTSDLKLYSGAILQKLVFAFKLAFLKVIENDMGTKLFMVLDSPRGKELDNENIELIMNLVKTELDTNQVFIASIYDLECEKRIEIKNQAIENRNE